MVMPDFIGPNRSRALALSMAPKRIHSLAIWFCTFSAAFALGEQAKTDRLPEPFWEKPANRKKLKDDRAVLVSVNTEDVKDRQGNVRLAMAGAGYVNRSREHAFKLSQEYWRLQDVSDHFKTVKWDPAKSELFVITEALRYQARMILKITPSNDDVAKKSRIGWEVIWGHFLGMKGEIALESIDAKTTLISLRGNYEAKELPLPKVLMGFALEIITQKVAEKMRTYIETHSPSVTASPTPTPSK